MFVSKLLLRLFLLLPVTAALAQAPLIETAETVPAADQWLQPGDRLQVRLKGQPGATATFLGAN
ncbi:hypothetical protein H9L05_05795 [Hymenobacter qilianensis]|uniref:Uncharacterized protein n=1 Tax=Hymenobacter qilianensis TaxID=1385715 RepID=A0A7H0GXZ7_9BACT|nr:hypothetical protein [Hymenobacter qilianensis]QNP53163.1 hypothetical protein H9L05_05795 [Hymenobacter qilianensis]